MFYVSTHQNEFDFMKYYEKYVWIDKRKRMREYSKKWYYKDK